MTENKDGLIIWDFDGVLNEGSPDLYYEGYYIALGAAECELSIEEQHARIDEKWGSSHKVIIDYVMAEKPENIPDAVEAFEDYMVRTFVERIQPVDGSTEMLGRLVAKYHLALNTAAPREALLNHVMPKLGIDQALFDAGIHTAEQFNSVHAKPSPAIINKIRSASGYPISQTVMIGDSVADMESARNAQVEPIAVTGTGNLNQRSVKELPYVRYSVDKVTEVEEILPEIMRKRIALGSAGLSGFGAHQMAAHA